MKKLNVLVVGANGYIGSKLINKFKKTTINWVGVDSLLRSDNNTNYETYSVNTYQNIKSSYLDEFTDCIWLAGHSSVSMSINDEYGALRNNLFDLINFTNIFRGRLIYASSGSVYSRVNAEFSKEDSPLFAATNMYDYTKICFDNYIKASNKKKCNRSKIWYS
jgi:UDP-glucose 4-epimerase